MIKHKTVSEDKDSISSQAGYRMVFYFLSTVCDPPTVLFMGRDKFENEDLIKHGWPEDVWFHVDKVSSAHVYLRLAPGQTLESVSLLLLLSPSGRNSWS